MTQPREHINQKAERSFNSLTVPELTYVTVQALVVSIQNGGLISYYYNAYADHLTDCMESLRRIGATDMLRLVEAMNSLFGGAVPMAVDDRNDVINSWDGDSAVATRLDEVAEEEQELAEVTDLLLEDYLRRNGLAA